MLGPLGQVIRQSIAFIAAAAAAARRGEVNEEDIKPKDGAAAAAVAAVAAAGVVAGHTATVAGVSRGVMLAVKIRFHLCLLSSTDHVLFSFLLILLRLRHLSYYFVWHYS